MIQKFELRTSKAILRSLQENYANNDRYMNNNVDILSSVAGAQVPQGCCYVATDNDFSTAKGLISSHWPIRRCVVSSWDL